MKNQYAGVFVSSDGSQLAVEKIVTLPTGQKELHYQYIQSGYKNYASEEFFNLLFKRELPSGNNINADIINLIRSGFEFKSFSGFTLDNRYLNIDLES